MKRKAKLIFLFVFVLTLLNSCAGNDVSDNYSALDYVHLYPYKGVEIQRTDIEVSDSDIDTYIYMEIQSKNITKPGETALANTIDDTAAMKYYGVSSAKELKMMFRNTIMNKRIWNIAYERIIENSIIYRMPKQRDEYVQRLIAVYEEDSAIAAEPIDEYIDNLFGLSYNDLCRQIENSFQEMMIVEAISEQENITYSNDEFSAKLKESAAEQGVSEQDMLKYNGEEYIIYLIRLDFIEKIVTAEAKII